MEKVPYDNLWHIINLMSQEINTLSNMLTGVSNDALIKAPDFCPEEVSKLLSQEIIVKDT